MSKRGVITGELLLFIVELTLIGLCFYSLMSFVKTVDEGTLLEKNFLSKDLALVLNTIYASPNVLQSSYFTKNIDLSKFEFTFTEGKVDVRDKNLIGIPTKYLYGYDNNIDLGKIEIKDMPKFDIANDGRKIFISSDLTLNNHKLYCTLPKKELSIGRIILDPGHGGADDIGLISGNIKESEYSLRFSEILENELSSDYFVTKTRNADYDVDRFDYVNSKVNSQNDIIFSIHLDQYAKTRNFLKAYVPMSRSPVFKNFVCNLLDRLSENEQYDSVVIFEINLDNIKKESYQSVLFHPNSVILEIGNIQNDFIQSNFGQNEMIDFSETIKGTLNDFKE